MSKWQQIIDAFFSIAYPQTCIGCEIESAIQDDVFCMSCKVKVGYTDHFMIERNEIMLKLLGRVEVVHAAALYGFQKKGSVQKAIHTLKYKRQSSIGTSFGKEFGRKFIESPHFNNPDFIIPIPIHRRKLRKRGYNPSTKFAEGIANILNVKIIQNVLVKPKEIESQTTKNRDQRLHNVYSSFQLNDGDRLIGKSVLLVDDVFTTGATIEAAVNRLSTIDQLKLQVGVIAMGQA